MRALRSQEEIMSTWKGDPDKPLVSICCITYNHELYIEDALEGFLIQETDFPFEILIHDDASKDRTADIIREYEANYPKLIKPIYQVTNKFSKGIRIISLVLPLTKGSYISICEGDDYWINKNKLQIQYDFLQKNTEFSICFHDAKIDVADHTLKHLAHKKQQIKTVFYLNDFIENNIIINCTVMYKWTHSKTLPDWFNRLTIGDWPLHIMQLQHGDAKYIKETMACYRVHNTGYWSGNISQNPSHKIDIKKNIYLTLPSHFFAYQSSIKLIEKAILKHSSESLDIYYIKKQYKKALHFSIINLKFLIFRKKIYYGFLLIARFFYIKTPSVYTVIRKLAITIKNF